MFSLIIRGNVAYFVNPDFINIAVRLSECAKKIYTLEIPIFVNFVYFC